MKQKDTIGNGNGGAAVEAEARRVVSYGEAAGMLGVSRGYVQKLVKRGRLVGVRRGGTVRKTAVTAESIDAVMRGEGGAV